RKGAGEESVRMADLIVDASGRTSRLPEWLESLGYEVPKPDLMKTAIGYSTRRYTLPPAMRHLAEEWDVVNIMGQPENNTFTGVFSFIENQVAELLLYRPGGKFPPTDAEAFEQTVAGL
ncbi:FAD dependent oxidoreductase, partial [Bacillus sp. SRB_28]